MESLAAISPGAWYNLGLAALLIGVVIVGVFAYRTWAAVHEGSAPITHEDLLAPFEAARAAGELNPEEYERVRRRIHEGGPGCGAS